MLLTVTAESSHVSFKVMTRKETAGTERTPAKTRLNFFGFFHNLSLSHIYAATILKDHFNRTLSTALESRFRDSLKAVESAVEFPQQEKRLNGENRIHGDLALGKTVESYRIALEEEIHGWDDFARALRKDDREAFDELMDMGRSFASKGNNATQPVIFEPMVLSIVLAQHEKMRQIEKVLNAIQPAPDISSEDKKPVTENPQAVASIFKRKSAGGEQTRLS
jgi:hypothetical protein